MQPGEYHKEIQAKIEKGSGQLCFFDPEHPLARKNGMVALGRHILSVKLGRWLEAGEMVHFEDGSPQNVSPENLSVTTRAALASCTRSPRLPVWDCFSWLAPPWAALGWLYSVSRPVFGCSNVTWCISAGAL